MLNPVFINLTFHCFYDDQFNWIYERQYLWKALQKKTKEIHSRQSLHWASFNNFHPIVIYKRRKYRKRSVSDINDAMFMAWYNTICRFNLRNLLICSKNYGFIFGCQILTFRILLVDLLPNVYFSVCLKKLHKDNSSPILNNK